MTEKKKRGRPPGSGKKAKTEGGQLSEKEIVALAEAAGPDNPDYNPTIKIELADVFPPEAAQNYEPSKMEAIAVVMEDVLLAQKKIDQLKQKPVIVHGKRIEVDAIFETPYPSNWDKMTKTEKLAYFTQHRK